MEGDWQRVGRLPSSASSSSERVSDGASFQPERKENGRRRMEGKRQFIYFQTKAFNRLNNNTCKLIGFKSRD